LKVYPFPRDKLVFKESLNGIFNIIDDGNAGGLTFPWKCHCSQRVLKIRTGEKVLKFYEFSDDDLYKHKYF